MKKIVNSFKKRDGSFKFPWVKEPPFVPVPLTPEQMLSAVHNEVNSALGAFRTAHDRVALAKNTLDELITAEQAIIATKTANVAKAAQQVGDYDVLMTKLKSFIP